MHCSPIWRRTTSPFLSSLGVGKRSKSSSSSIDYCTDLVRKHDYEMFLCTLLIPDPSLRTKVMVMRAFNTEVALARDQVSHKDLGLARLLFWRETLDQLFQKRKGSMEGVRRQPAVLELSRLISEHTVSKKWLLNLVEGRERLMSDAPFTDLAELERYADQTVTSLFYLAFEVLGIKNVEVDHAASHLGKAIGIATFIRSIPYNAQGRRVLVPKDVLMKHGVSQEDLIRQKNQDKVKEMTYEIASQAHIHYEKAKNMKDKVDKKALPLFLSGVPSNIYLKRLQRVHFDPYHPSLQQRYGLLPWHLYFKRASRSYY